MKSGVQSLIFLQEIYVVIFLQEIYVATGIEVQQQVLFPLEEAILPVLPVPPLPQVLPQDLVLQAATVRGEAQAVELKRNNILPVLFFAVSAVFINNSGELFYRGLVIALLLNNDIIT